MMAEYEYIEKQAAIEQFKSVAEQQTLIHDLNRRRFEFKDIVEVIGRIPPANVRPVVRGKWLDYDDTERFTAKCSLCGTWIDTRFSMNFCPNCGADMRETKE